MNGQSLPPLAVDLDGTLVLSDTLHESLIALLRRNPLYLFAMPFWLLGGKARFKREIAQRILPPPESLPYNQPLLEWLRGQRDSREIVLCTAADAAIARAIAGHVGCFDTVIASDGERNLSGEAKAETLVERYGAHGFDYAGNDRIDLAVWSKARRAIVVNASPATEHAARRIADVTDVMPRKPVRLWTWVRALRLHQWAKNLLVFVPLLSAHMVMDPTSVERALLAFLAFGLCASSVYLLNDLVDLPLDRAHPRKRHRPFAAGELSPLTGLVLAPILLATAFVIALWLPERFLFVLAGYYLLTFAYSFRLKRVEMLDVIVLAALYTARIIAGAAAIAVPLSFWLLAFSMFLFLSLALIKRFTELALMRDNGLASAAGRGYRIDDLSLLGTLGVSSGYLSVLVLALYINSRDSEALYHHPKMLWLLCPLLLYWISRSWSLTYRGRMHDDPLLFALKDPASLVVSAIGLVIVLFAV